MKLYDNYPPEDLRAIYEADCKGLEIEPENDGE